MSYYEKGAPALEQAAQENCGITSRKCSKYCGDAAPGDTV